MVSKIFSACEMEVGMDSMEYVAHPGPFRDVRASCLPVPGGLALLALHQCVFSRVCFIQVHFWTLTEDYVLMNLGSKAVVPQGRVNRGTATFFM